MGKPATREKGKSQSILDTRPPDHERDRVVGIDNRVLYSQIAILAWNVFTESNLRRSRRLSWGVLADGGAPVQFSAF